MSNLSWKRFTDFATTVPAPRGGRAGGCRLLARVMGWLMMALLATAAQSVAQAQPSVTLTNTTRGGTDLIAGDNFRIDVTGGSPNAAVTVGMTKNGSSLGTWSMGTTNGSGTYTLTGSVSAGDVGSWTETWYVGGVQAVPVLVFSVFAVTGSISASPNPCLIYYGQWYCSTTVSWSTQGASSVQVWVAVDGGGEVLFAGSGGGGWYSSAANWIQNPSVYVFVLYDYSSGNRGAVLGTSVVTANRSDACPL